MLRQFVVEPRSFNKLNEVQKKDRLNSKKIRIVQVTCVGWEGDHTLAYSLDQLQATTESTLSQLEVLGIKPTDISLDFFFHFENPELKKELDDVIASGKYSFLNDTRIRKFTHGEHGRTVEKNYAETGKDGNYQQTEAYKLARHELQQIIDHEKSKAVMEEVRQTDKRKFRDRHNKKNKNTDSLGSKKDYGFNFTDAQLMAYYDSTTAELLSFVPKLKESNSELVIFLYPHDYLLQWCKIIGNATQEGFASIVGRDPEAFIPLKIKFSKSPANQLSPRDQAASASSATTAATTTPVATTTAATSSTALTMNALATASRAEGATQSHALTGDLLPVSSASSSSSTSSSPRSTASRCSYGEPLSDANRNTNLAFKVLQKMIGPEAVSQPPVEKLGSVLAFTHEVATLTHNSFSPGTSPGNSIGSRENSQGSSVASMSTTSSVSSTSLLSSRSFDDDAIYNNMSPTPPLPTPMDRLTTQSEPIAITRRGGSLPNGLTATHANFYNKVETGAMAHSLPQAAADSDAPTIKRSDSRPRFGTT